MRFPVKSVDDRRLQNEALIYIRVIKSHEVSRTLKDICREPGTAHGTFYNRCKKYVGLEANEAE